MMSRPVLGERLRASRKDDDGAPDFVDYGAVDCAALRARVTALDDAA